MRDICKVIDFLIAEVVPRNEHHVIDYMKHVAKKASYTSPETMQHRWIELGVFLTAKLGDEHSAEWKVRVACIMRDEEKLP